MESKILVTQKKEPEILPEIPAKIEMKEPKKNEESHSIQRTKITKRVDPNNFPLLDEGIELENKPINANTNNEINVTPTSFSKSNEMQRSIKQKTDIEKWSKHFLRAHF